MKKIFLLVLALQGLSLCTVGQVIYNNSFNNLTLQNFTTATSSTQYTTVPSSFSLIGDTLKNNIGSASNPNRPFHVPALKKTGWAAVYNAAENDTFLVSTSWLDTTLVNVDRWVITPSITTISANSVLTWFAKSPDPSFPDGYEVYGTNKTGVLATQDFLPGDRLFALPDGNTSGQGEKSTWTRRSINLGAFAGNTLRFAFRNNSKDMYQLWIDDIQVITLPNSTDAAIQHVITDKYVLINSSNTIKLNVMNMGASDIGSIGINYSVNNSSVNSETVALSTSLSYGQNGIVSFALPYPAISSPGYYTIKSWISSVNNTADQNHANDTAVCYVTVQASAPSHTMMIEQFVSANDGESVDAQARTNALQTAPAIVVNIHDGDSLKEAGSAALISDYKQTSSTAMLDRYYFDGASAVTIPRPSYGNYVNIQKYRLSPAAISIQNKLYDTITRQLTFTVKTDFVGEVKGDYRINAYLTENNVCGPYTDSTNNGYNQVNNYYTVSWSEFYHLGNYSPTASAYVIDPLRYNHQNTLVHSFDGAYGLPGTIPSTGGTQNSSFQKTFTLTLPTPAAGIHKFNPDNIYIVGFVAEYNTDKTKRAVLNTVRQKLTTKPEYVGISETARDISLSVYPNPSASGLFHLNTKGFENYTLNVYDIFGKCLKTETGAKAATLDLSQLADGIYLLTLQSGKTLLTEKLIIQKN